MTLFEERNYPKLGLLSVVVISLAVMTALNLDKLPVFGEGTTYAAEFTEAAGLSDTAEVRVNGFKVGRVNDVALDGDHIRVEFTVKDIPLGDETTASIEIKTLLGQKYLEVSPAGSGVLDPSRPIPRERTQVPYDIAPVVNDLSATVQQLDTGQLANSFQVLSDTFAGSPRHITDALSGLSRISETIAKRDAELSALLKNTHQISGTLASRNTQFKALLEDGRILLDEVQRRKAAISKLLSATTRLSKQLRGLVRDNQHQIGPALAELGKVTDILQRNQDSLRAGLRYLAPAARLSNNVIGNGRFFEVYMCGMIPPNVNTGPLSVNPHGCLPPTAKGKRGGR